MLPHLASVCQKVIQISICLKCDNNTVNTIPMMIVNGLYSVLGANYRVWCTKYGGQGGQRCGGHKHLRPRSPR